MTSCCGCDACHRPPRELKSPIPLWPRCLPSPCGDPLTPPSSDGMNVDAIIGPLEGWHRERWQASQPREAKHGPPDMFCLAATAVRPCEHQATAYARTCSSPATRL